MDVTTWFRRWLSGHPLKEPPASSRAAYTAEVMQRVRALRAPSPMPALPWLAWPRLALVPLAAAAVVLLVVARVRQPEGSLAGQVAADADLLTALGQPLLSEPASGNGLQELAQELELADALVLAEAPPDDEAWLEQTLQLLEQLEDTPAGDAESGTSSDEEWLDELELLDESEPGASS